MNKKFYIFAAIAAVIVTTLAVYSVTLAGQNGWPTRQYEFQPAEVNNNWSGYNQGSGRHCRQNNNECPHAQGSGQGRNFIDANNNNVCDHLEE